MNHLRQAWAQRITASKFSPSQVASWETTKPWSASRQDLEAQMIPGFRVGSARGSEDASFEQGVIVLKEQWFSRPSGARRATCYHEAGHGLETQVRLPNLGRYFGVDNALDVIDLPGATRFGDSVSEVVAEAYAVLWTEPGWATFEGGKVILDVVKKMARAEGYPLPSNA